MLIHAFYPPFRNLGIEYVRVMFNEIPNYETAFPTVIHTDVEEQYVVITIDILNPEHNDLRLS